MSTTTTTVTLPCPECGEDISRQACIGHDLTNGLRVVWAGDAKDSAHVCKPKGIDPESLEEWTLCEIEDSHRGRCYREVRRGLYLIASDPSDASAGWSFPDGWRIVRTIPTGDNVVELKPTEVVVSIEGLDKAVLRRVSPNADADGTTYKCLARVANAASDRGLLDEEA